MGQVALGGCALWFGAFRVFIVFWEMHSRIDGHTSVLSAMHVFPFPEAISSDYCAMNIWNRIVSRRFPVPVFSGPDDTGPVVPIAAGAAILRGAGYCPSSWRGLGMGGYTGGTFRRSPFQPILIVAFHYRMIRDPGRYHLHILADPWLSHAGPLRRACSLSSCGAARGSWRSCSWPHFPLVGIAILAAGASSSRRSSWALLPHLVPGGRPCRHTTERVLSIRRRWGRRTVNVPADVRLKKYDGEVDA